MKNETDMQRPARPFMFHDLTPSELPWWARALDGIGLALLLVGLSITLTGGFREWTPLGRLSVTSWIRPVVIGVVLLLLRHGLRRTPSLPARMAMGLEAWRGSVEAGVVWPIVLSTRVGVLVVGFLAIGLIGYAPNTLPWRVYDNDFLNLTARWDTGWYLGIAMEGYSWQPAQATRQQNIAFFPVYPMLMRYGSLFLARHYLIAGVLISLVAFFFALTYLFRFARDRMDDERAATSLALLAAYPFAFFFSAAYTEALFLLTVVAACYHFERDELWKAAVWGLVAGLTRPNGCLLSIVLALLAIRAPKGQARRTAAAEATAVETCPPKLQRRRKPRNDVTPWRAPANRIAVAAMPGIGMLIFSTYIYFLTGNPLQWAAQNAAWGRVYRSMGTLVGDRIDFIQQNGFYDYASNSGLEMIQAAALIFVLISVWPVYRRFGLPYAAMILVNVLPPLAMGGLLSMGRVTSVIFPTFLWLGAVIPARQRPGWLIAFGMLQALGAVVFFTWRPLY